MDKKQFLTVLNLIKRQYQRYLQMNSEEKTKYSNYYHKRNNETHIGLCYIATDLLERKIISDFERKEFIKYLYSTITPHKILWLNEVNYVKAKDRLLEDYRYWLWKPSRSSGRLGWLNKHIRKLKNEINVNSTN